MTALVPVGRTVLAPTVEAPADGGPRAGLQPPQKRRLTMSGKHKLRAIGQTTVKTYEPTAFDEMPGGADPE